jgi:Holliday junction resolvasome RuvABC DNA-binding subunit
MADEDPFFSPWLSKMPFRHEMPLFWQNLIASPKSAQKIIMELSDKDISMVPAKSLVPAAQKSIPPSSNISTAMAALVSLEYRTVDPKWAIQQSIEWLSDDLSTEKTIWPALTA